MPTDKPKNPTKATTGGVTAEKVVDAAKRAFYDVVPLGMVIDNIKNPSQEDKVIENLSEIGDLSGVASWDDAYRAWNRYQESDDTLPDFWDAVDMVTALPLVGKAGGVAKGFKLAKGAKSASSFADFMKMLGSAANYADGAQDLYQNVAEEEVDDTPMPSPGYFDKAIIDARKELQPIQETTRVPYMASPVYNLKVYK